MWETTGDGLFHWIMDSYSNQVQRFEVKKVLMADLFLTNTQLFSTFLQIWWRNKLIYILDGLRVSTCLQYSSWTTPLNAMSWSGKWYKTCLCQTLLHVNDDPGQVPSPCKHTCMRARVFTDISQTNSTHSTWTGHLPKLNARQDEHNIKLTVGLHY